MYARGTTVGTKTVKKQWAQQWAQTTKRDVGANDKASNNRKAMGTTVANTNNKAIIVNGHNK